MQILKMELKKLIKFMHNNFRRLMKLKKLMEKYLKKLTKLKNFTKLPKIKICIMLLKF